jgi:hypothetical protein
VTDDNQGLITVGQGKHLINPGVGGVPLGVTDDIHVKPFHPISVLNHIQTALIGLNAGQ